VRGTMLRLSIGMLFNEGAIGLYNTLWPLYLASLGASPPQIGLVISLSGLARMVSLLPSTMLATRVPPRRLIVAMRGLAALGLLGCGIAQHWWHVLPPLVLVSVGVLAFPALSNLLAGLGGDAAERTRIFTIVYTVAPSFAYVITPAISGLIGQAFGLRWTLIGAGILTACAALTFATVPAPTSPVAPSSGTGYRIALAHPGVRWVSGLMLITLTVLQLGLILAPNYLQDVHGVPVEWIGWFGSAAAVGSVVLSIAISRVRALQAPFTALMLSVGLVAVGMVLLLIGHSMASFVVAYVLRGGFLVAWSVFYAAYGEVTPEHLRPPAFALAEIIGSASSTLAPYAAGWLYIIHPRTPIVAALGAIVPLCWGIAAIKQKLAQAPAIESVARDERTLIR